MGKDLDGVWRMCCTPLRLSSCVGERRYGLASVLELKCSNCGFTTKVSTAKTHHSADNETYPGGSRGRPAYDVNTKAALGMINAGVGATHLNNMLASMNIPPIHHKSLKRWEREVGSHLESAAKRSCKEALIAERRLSNDESAKQAMLASKPDENPAPAVPAMDPSFVLHTIMTSQV